MLNRLPSVRRLRRLNRRQRKKLRVAEFQERVFEIRITFREPLDESAANIVLDALFDRVESSGLLIAGLGGRVPLMAMDGMVSAQGRGSPSESDRQALLAWVRQRPEVAQADVGAWVDGWYGWQGAL